MKRYVMRKLLQLAANGSYYIIHSWIYRKIIFPHVVCQMDPEVAHTYALVWVLFYGAFGKQR